MTLIIQLCTRNCTLLHLEILSEVHLISIQISVFPLNTKKIYFQKTSKTKNAMLAVGIHDQWIFDEFMDYVQMQKPHIGFACYCVRHMPNVCLTHPFVGYC